MKKKIFITGAVREYDSSNPVAFTNAISDYIKENIVDEKSRDKISVSVREVSPDQLVINFPFSTGEEITPDTISHDLYRCFFGESNHFRSKYSLGAAPYLGPYVKVNCREDIKDVKNAHKRNTAFYGADKYKRLILIENKFGLEVRFFFEDGGVKSAKVSGKLSGESAGSIGGNING